MGVALAKLSKPAQVEVLRQIAAQNARRGLHVPVLAVPKLASKSDLEVAWLTLWRRHAQGEQEPVGQWKFAMGLPRPRKFQIDYGYVAERIGIELHGLGVTGAKRCRWCGQRIAGRHLRPEGFNLDRYKINLALSMGIRVFEFTGDELRKDPIGCVTMVRVALHRSRGKMW